MMADDNKPPGTSGQSAHDIPAATQTWSCIIQESLRTRDCVPIFPNPRCDPAKVTN